MENKNLLTILKRKKCMRNRKTLLISKIVSLARSILGKISILINLAKTKLN